MEDIAAILKEYFEDKENVFLVFIFGSAVNDRLTKESDVDIAVLFKQTPDFKEIIHFKGDLLSVIKRETDIVVLNNSSPVIRMQVLKNGVLVINKNSAIYNDFFVRTVKEYDDLKRVRKEAEDNILKGRIYA
ncbi:MAG: hypothetical protein A2X55_00350 [Nitrospirae bacterium GWB2_47_37]|nr:MAG: hypothetical protein A2Z82_11330 [Nitrospirae bacterium GWA2_46_11]OGW23683.1 MAG: hypothetical protein A2X55_00350 [Nitrospirae bacterium GWB2_47_37]